MAAQTVGVRSARLVQRILRGHFFHAVSLDGLTIT